LPGAVRFRSWPPGPAWRRFVIGTAVWLNDRPIAAKEKPMASKANQKRVAVTLECTVCKRRNYITEKNKVNDRERIEMKKYCRWERTHTVHKETR
jgi:large subunit ribosomal protein L33